MGASSWHNYTPYRASAEEALQELRREVFARGEYSFGGGGFAGPGGPLAGLGALPPGFGAIPPAATQLFEGIAQMPGTEGRIMRAAMSGDYTGLDNEERQAAQQLRPIFQLAQGGGFTRGSNDEGGFGPDEPPGSIEELLEMVAEDGTHSVLDIEHTDTRRGFGVAIPLPPRRIAAFFGSDRPTHEQVEENWDSVAEGLERWQAYYLTVYRDGEPHEYAFIGCSGD